MTGKDSWSRGLMVNSALQLDRQDCCVQSGTTTIDNLADFFSSNGMTLQEVVSGSIDKSIKNYDTGLCSVLTSDLVPALCVTSPSSPNQGTR